MSNEQAPRAGAARLGPRFAALVVGLFLIFNLNFRELGLLDPIPSTLLPVSLLRDGDADLSEFRALLEADAAYGSHLWNFGALQEIEGRLVSSYPLGAALIATPFYAVPVWLGWLETWRDFAWMGKLTASLLVALSAGFLFLAAHEIAGERVAYGIALSYALATDAWAVASQALWQHGPGMLCLSVALWLALRLERGDGARAAWGLGVALALAVLCRSLNVVPAAVLGLFVLVRQRRALVPTALPLAVAGVWQAAYNLSTYGELSGGHRALIENTWQSASGFTLENAFTFPLLEGLASILVSPGKGLLVYTPQMAFALAALIPAALDRSFALGRYLALWIVLAAIPLAKYVLWWGGASFGPRYLCEALLPLTLVLAWLWPRLAGRAWLRAAFAASVAVGFGVQVVGAFFAPCGWSEDPAPVDHLPERLWHCDDTQIERCLRAGPRGFELLEPAPPA